MKKSLIFILLGSVLIPSCGTNTNPYSKEITLYVDKEGEEQKLKITFFNGNKEIPYLSIKDVADLLNFEGKLEGNIYTVRNKKNDSTMTINGETGEVIYPDFAKFQSNFKTEDGDYLQEFLEVDSEFVARRVNEKCTYTPCSEYKLNLNDFDLKPIKYSDDYYLPINIGEELFHHSGNVFYFDSKEGLYHINKNGEYYDTLSPRTSYSKDFYEYCFNELSLNVELYFGLKGYSRTMRSTKTIYKYFPNGVKKEFASYKEGIINSSTIQDFDKGIAKMIGETMDDGGHTYPGKGSFGTDRKWLEEPKDYTYSDKIETEYKKKRKNSPDNESISSKVSVFDTDKDGKSDIGFITFNDFSEETKKDSIDIREIFTGADGANTLLNPNDSNYNKTTSDIKDIVIDISGNTGGSVTAEGYVLSWICGGVAEESLKATNGNGYSFYAYNFDINGDKQYSKEDYLPDNVNVYILMSEITYSAANSLAYNSYLYNRKSGVRKIRLMGSQTGGGACSVTQTKYLSSGLSYRLANNSVSVDPNNKSICCEDGVMPDEGLALTYDQMVDRSGINGICNLLVSKR